MRSLVRNTSVSGVVTDTDRAFPQWDTAAAINYGQKLNLRYRYEKLIDEVNMLAHLGADWDVIRTSGNLVFNIYFPFKGRDLRINNPCGEAPIIFSTDLANVVNPNVVLDRTGGPFQ